MLFCIYVVCTLLVGFCEAPVEWGELVYHKNKIFDPSPLSLARLGKKNKFTVIVYYRYCRLLSGKLPLIQLPEIRTPYKNLAINDMTSKSKKKTKKNSPSCINANNYINFITSLMQNLTKDKIGSPQCVQITVCSL